MPNSLQKVKPDPLNMQTWLLTMKKNNITVTGIYHPPPKNAITNRMFINDVTDHLMTLLTTTTNNIILGDFNMHINDTNSNDACTFLDTFTALGLTQYVTTSTHVKGNILNLMFTEEISSIKLTTWSSRPLLIRPQTCDSLTQYSYTINREEETISMQTSWHHRKYLQSCIR